MKVLAPSLLACATLAAGLLPTSALPQALAQPTVAPDGRPLYPEGVPVPRGLTEAERRYLERHPLVGGRGTTEPPSGPLHTAAEYEPMEGILLAWESFNNILAQMAAQITTVGDADVYIVVDSTEEGNTAQSQLASAGVNLSRVHLVVRTTDTVWIRDYGPRYVFEGDCRVVVDHTYNRPRPNDDVLPVFFAGLKGHAFYEHPLIHGGGNFHLDALGRGYATRLIANENPGLTEPQIIGIWRDYLGLETHLFDPFRTSVDATQHLDMWMQVIADDAVVISDFVNGTPAFEDSICDAAASFMASRGYTVHRVPAMSLGGVHYTYTNVVMCNDLVLLPFYNGNSTIAAQNAAALAAWQSAVPGKTVVQIDCDSMVSFAGVMHCIAMHLPAHRGGLAPTAYLKWPNGGETYTPGDQVEIRWISDDDEAVTEVDVLLSLDGGATWPITIAEGRPRLGSLDWTVPDVGTAQARIRVVARDAQGRTGHDDSDADFAIAGGCDADFDGDGSLTPADFAAFRAAFLAGDAAADFDGDANLTPADFSAFRQAFLAGCPQ